MSIASSINKLIAGLLGDNFTGTVVAVLKKNNLKLVSGSSELSVVSDGVIYQMAEKDIAVLKDGNYTFKVSDGYLSEMSKNPAPPAAPSARRKAVTGGNSSARERRVMD